MFIVTNRLKMTVSGCFSITLPVDRKRASKHEYTQYGIEKVNSSNSEVYFAPALIRLTLSSMRFCVSLEVCFL